MGSWLPWVIAAIPSILQLFRGKETPKQIGDYSQTGTQTVVSPPSGYQSPILGMWDMLMSKLMGQNIRRYAGMGFPEGQGLDTSWITQMMSALGPDWTKLLAKMQDVRTPAGRISKPGSSSGFSGALTPPKKITPGSIKKR